MMIASLQFSDYVSIIALVVALLSFATAFYFGFRDRVNVKAFSTFYKGHEEYGAAHMEVRLVNHGRRVAVITMFGGDLENGGWEGTNLGEKGLGIRLAEHEFHTERLGKEEIFARGPECEDKYVNLWFEDSLGKRHPVKDSKKHLGLL